MEKKTWGQRAGAFTEEAQNIARRLYDLEKENDRLEYILERRNNKQKPDMTKPQPCTKFRNAKTIEWIAKLAEETSDVVQEAKDMDECVLLEKRLSAAHARDRLAEELTDVITVCVSWLDALGYDEEMRGELHRRVNEKNKKRGYF